MLKTCKFEFLKSLLRVVKKAKVEVPKVDNSTFGALNESDISSHLALMHFLIHLFRPSNVVELGTREGQSTRALKLAVKEIGIRGVGVDLSPAPSGFIEQHDDWKHFQGDDIAFAKKLKVKSFRKKILGSESIDLLFIDTSHEYEHTKRELENYWPLLSSPGVLILHDTNLSTNHKMDIDGRVYVGWDNNRGVTRAVEEFFDISINEKTVFSRSMGHCVFFHVPWGNGILLILKNR